MHAVHAALSSRSGPVSPAVAELLAVLEQAGPELAVMDVQISSFGGVGSTQLSNHLNAYGITTNLLNDVDNLRHCPRPPEYSLQSSALTTCQPSSANPKSSSRPRHVVYLYGDPLAAIASHFRRGHACHQAQKTCGNPATLSAATFPSSLEEYVARGEDLFGLRKHFISWLTAPRDYPVVMLRYERMFDADVAEPLFQLLCSHKLPPEQLEGMVVAFTACKRPRKCKVPVEMYDKMYGDLLAEMDRLPPLYIRFTPPTVIFTADTPETGTMVAKIGAPAPKWKAQAVVDGGIKEISLDDFQGKYVVFFFYPLDFTFVCPTEIVAFSDRLDEFKAINCEVIGASIDSQFTHLAFSNTPRNKGGLGGCKYPLVADLTKKIAQEYGVLIEDGPDAGVTLRGLFIISPTGILRQITINDLPVGRSVDETLRLVKAFQFTDEHGEVCPANWNPGAKTMKADPTMSLEYFSTLS